MHFSTPCQQSQRRLTSTNSQRPAHSGCRKRLLEHSSLQEKRPNPRCIVATCQPGPARAEVAAAQTHNSALQRQEQNNQAEGSSAFQPAADQVQQHQQGHQHQRQQQQQQPPPSMPSLRPTAPSHLGLLATVNEATKWAVSAFTFCTLVWRHDMLAAWCVLGAVLSSFLCKVLKHAINEQRPPTARKMDPGMPSSHANSLAFLATYAAAAVLHSMGSSSPAARGMASAAVGSGLFLAWLRVKLGYHTRNQVLVGLLVGTSSALCWWWLGVSHAFAAVQQHAAANAALGALTLVAMAAFGIKNVLAWRKEHQQPGAGVPKLA